MVHCVYSLRRRAVARYASARKVHFRKMLYVALSVKPMTLKMLPLHVDLEVSNCVKFH